MKWKLEAILIFGASLLLVGCASQVFSPSGPTPVNTPPEARAGESQAKTPLEPDAKGSQPAETRGGSTPGLPVAREPNVLEKTAELDTPEKAAELDTPEKAAKPDNPELSELPDGALALFNRVDLGNDSHSLPTSGGTVEWETGGRGILRYIPVNNSYQVMKRIVTTSYSSSTVYPLTVGDRLFSIRDWGMDWTAKNKRFTIDEIDPVTGKSLSTTDVTAEWFTILEDELFYRSEVVDDFWGGPPTGGHLMVKRLGDLTGGSERKLAVSGFRFHAVGGHLISLSDGRLYTHDRHTGEVRTEREIAPQLLEGIWPDSRSIFFGEEAIYWAASFGDPNEITIVRLPLDGAPEAVVSFSLDGYETGLVIDDVPGVLMVGVTSSAPPNGIGITQIFLVSLDGGSDLEVPVDRHIPAAQLEAGGGLQLLRLHPD